MDLNKLKIEKFKSIQLVNFPHDVDLGIGSATRNVEVIFYYIDELDDVKKFVKLDTVTKGKQDNYGLQEGKERRCQQRFHFPAVQKG
jgi:hypothetical protein